MWKEINIILLLVSVVLFGGCLNSNEPSIKTGVDACALCNMVIDQPNQAAGYFIDGEFFPFDSPLCMLMKMVEKRKDGGLQPQRISVVGYSSGSWVNAEEATFLITSHVPTVMNSQTLCFASVERATQMKNYPDEQVTDWRGFVKSRGTPDQTIEVVINQDKMIPETVSCQKGELIELHFTSQSIEDTLWLAVKGYSEDGKVAIRGTGTVASLLILADKPGAGFPIIQVQSETIYGMLKVSGAHTTDEEVM